MKKSPVHLSESDIKYIISIINSGKRSGQFLSGENIIKFQLQASIRKLPVVNSIDPRQTKLK